MKSEWEVGSLDKFILFKNGKRRPLEKGAFPVYGGNGILDYAGTYNAEDGIIIGRVGAYCGSTYYEANKFWVSDNAILAQNRANSLIKYCYYLLKSFNLNSYHIGTSQPLLTQEILNSIEANVPSLPTQKAIADTLSALDDKIELNNRINQNLEAQAQALFKHWFVDFEFPDENGEPYKSSGGKMVESELGLIPEGWRVGGLGEIIELHDAKRVPLSSRVREKMDKIYPYYGAASLMDYVDDYIFDGTYLLLGEDGTVTDEIGYPILQYVFGKFWVNNHAHVITGKNNFTIEVLYMILKNMNINSIVTGAVQKKINQANLKSLPIIIASENIIEIYANLIKPIFNSRKNIENQNKTLAQTRDTLLPKLMSGEIEVPINE